MMTDKYKRRQYFIIPGLQLRFARFVVVFVFISCILTALVVFYTTFMMLGSKLADVYPQGRLAVIFKSAHLVFLLNMFVLLPIIFCFSIMFSHRVAGPLPKIYETLRQIGRGDFRVNLILRDRDELKDLAEEINQMAKNLAAKEQKK